MTVPRDADVSYGEDESEEEVTMFITVRYGDNKQQIFNPNCLNKVLLANIKKRCECGSGDTVDLSDEEGRVKNLHTYPKDYGTGYFTNRETLILLKVEKRESDYDSVRTTFTPLLFGMEEDKEFLGKINPKPLRSKRDQKSPSDKKRDSVDLSIPNRARRRSSVKNPKVLKKFQKVGQAVARSKHS